MAVAVQRVKVIVLLHEGDTSTSKLWSFEAESIQEYTFLKIQGEVLSLFPHLKEKNYSVELWHEDDLVGKVNIE